MSYGSSSFGSVSYGGSAVDDRNIFFVPEAPLVAGLQSKEVEFFGSTPFYVVHIHMDSFFAEPEREVKVYTRSSEGESPQLQATLGEGFESETLIGAARFIKVEINADSNLSNGGMFITGRGAS